MARTNAAAEVLKLMHAANDTVLLLFGFGYDYCSKLPLANLEILLASAQPKPTWFPSVAALLTVCVCVGKSHRGESSLFHLFLPPCDIIALALPRTKYSEDGFRSLSNRDPKSR
jgi:hypothetical protein